MTKTNLQAPKRYKVCITQPIIIGRRAKAEPVQRCFSVNAKSVKGAVKAVRDAGYSTKQVEVTRER